ncbi:hypothetical protein Cgig2_027715 [Carnegiea gigantea]|uniref:Uncharacterized protein n=1 Tax=Carnegiea gigantea TaxID=171969 RepID=A0A9Q1Q590_9CARY|nr:hypothetical protein Cgig2_027715 [Carnegiea gigantea]
MRHKQHKHFFQEAEGNRRKNLKTILQAAGLFGDDLEETLKQHQFVVTEIEEELDKLPRPKDFSIPQWSKYKNYLKSAEFKKYSQNGKAAWALKSHMHTTGTKSFVQCRAEFNDAEARMESHRASGSYATEVEIDKEVWTHFMGDDKPGRAKLFGTGVTKSQVKRLHDGSLITRNDGGIVTDNPTTTKLHHLQNVFVQQKNRMQQQEQMLLNIMQVVARLESQVALYQTALKDCRCVNLLSSTLLIGAHTYSGEVYCPQVPDQPVNGN